MRTSLTNIVESLTQPFVIALDSPWGTGKTTFLRMWKTMLEDKKAPCLMFNAWRNDFVDDPMTAFIAEIGEEVKKVKTGLGKDTVKKWSKVRAVTGVVWKKGVPMALDSLTRGWLSSMGDELSEDALAESAGKLASEAAKASINAYSEQKKSMAEFKKNLEEFVDSWRKEPKTWDGPQGSQP